MIHTVNFFYVLIRYFIVDMCPRMVTGSLLLQLLLNVVWIVQMSHTQCFETDRHHEDILTTLL